MNFSLIFFIRPILEGELLMLVSSLNDHQEFVAGDGTLLRELLHPDKQPVTIGYSLAYARLTPGKVSLKHRLRSSEVYYVLQGQGRMHVDAQERLVKPGDAVYIPPGAQQHIESLGPGELAFLCIVDPAWRAEDETVES
jgi:mannose-6-phosphate isomerase-like protein (cupin superfamily)